MFYKKRGERAENGTRTRDPNLGKVVLYQLSYFRITTAFGREHFSKCGAKVVFFFFTANFSEFFFIFLRISSHQKRGKPFGLPRFHIIYIELQKP